MFDDMKRFEARAFLILLMGATILLGWLLLPFFDVLFWSVVIGVLFAPVNLFLHGKGLGTNISALLTVLLCLILLILPLAWVLYSCLHEGASLYAHLTPAA